MDELIDSLLDWSVSGLAGGGMTVRPDTEEAPSSVPGTVSEDGNVCPSQSNADELVDELLSGDWRYSAPDGQIATATGPGQQAGSHPGLDSLALAEPEKWAVIAEAPQYEVSSLGRLRGRRGLVSGAMHKHGFVTVVLAAGAKKLSRAVHRLVAEAHVPNRQGCKKVWHLDGDRHNNSASNLAWVESDPQEKRPPSAFPQAVSIVLAEPGGKTRRWGSIMEAAAHAGVHPVTLTKWTRTAHTSKHGQWFTASDWDRRPAATLVEPEPGTAEVWRPVAEIEGYMVSDRGRVLGKRGVPMALVEDATGYQSASLFIAAEKRTVYRRVHRLVAAAFIPNPFAHPAVNHINGVRADNRVENLEWVTSQENAQRTVYPATSSRRRSRRGRAHCRTARKNRGKVFAWRPPPSA